MKLNNLIQVLFLILLSVTLWQESLAVRPPLKPLSSEQFQKMVSDADVIAVGTVTSVKLKKTLQLPLETVIVHANITCERILKGDKSIRNILIEESYQRFFENNIGKPNDSRHVTEETVTASIAGPLPPVGKYWDGERILVFLKSIGELNQYRPVGSGDHDAYIGVFLISSEGVISDRYPFDEVLTGYARSETDFINFLISIKGK